MRWHKQWFAVFMASVLSTAAWVSVLHSAEPAKERKEGDQSPVQVVQHYRASVLTGMKVKNPEGEDLGKIEDLVIDLETGKVRYAALSFGGFLGVGDKLFAVPMQVLILRHDEEDAHFVLDVAKDRLEKAPGFNSDAWPEFGDPSWGSEVDTFYGVAEAKAAPQRHSGTVVSMTDDELVMTDAKSGKEHSHVIGPHVQITVNGKRAKTRDLKRGDSITVTTMAREGKEVVAAIEAATTKR